MSNLIPEAAKAAGLKAIRITNTTAMKISDEIRGKLYHKMIALQNQAQENAKDAEGAEYHDCYTLVNIYDELRATIYTAKRAKQWNKKLDVARRMAKMISDKELRSAVLESLDEYQL